MANTTPTDGKTRKRKPKTAASPTETASAALPIHGGVRGTLAPGSPWRDVYLEVLANTGVLMAAADAVGMSRQAALQMRKADAEFEELVGEAMDRYRRKLHDEAMRRAVEGWDEPVIGGQWKDQIVAYVRKYDSRLLELLLKRHDPEFRVDRQATLQVQGSVQHNHKHTLDMASIPPEDLAHVMALLGTGEEAPDVTDAEILGEEELGAP